MENNPLQPQSIIDTETKNKGLVRILLYGLLATLILCILFSGIIALWEPIEVGKENAKESIKREIPNEFLVAISAIIGYLGGLITPTPKSDS